MTDRQKGIVWEFDDITKEGRLESKQLKRLSFDQGFWFEWVAFLPETEMY